MMDRFHQISRRLSLRKILSVWGWHTRNTLTKDSAYSSASNVKLSCLPMTLLSPRLARLNSHFEGRTGKLIYSKK